MSNDLFSRIANDNNPVTLFGPGAVQKEEINIGNISIPAPKEGEVSVNITIETKKDIKMTVDELEKLNDNKYTITNTKSGANTRGDAGILVKSLK